MKYRVNFFKSSENIQKKEGGPDRPVSNNKFSLVTPNTLSTKVKSMQRSGTEAIRTQLQPSKSKREITNITNSQKTKITYGQPSEQLFPKRWPLSNRNRTKNNINTRKVKRHRNSNTKKQVTENHNKTTALE